jgi:hypothetical protein
VIIDACCLVALLLAVVGGAVRGKSALLFRDISGMAVAVLDI